MKLFLLIPAILFAHFCSAQAPDERVEAIRMAFITKELQLTPGEAQQFWPVYNNYVNELKSASATYPNDEIKREETIVEIRKKYKDPFKKILNSDDRVNKVYTLERKYRELLRNELQKRQQKQP